MDKPPQKLLDGFVKRFMPEFCIKIDVESSILSILTRRQAGSSHMLRYLGLAIVLLWLHPKVPCL